VGRFAFKARFIRLQTDSSALPVLYTANTNSL
jgi:hypothetical protein